jgi:hypothetical protein
MWLLLKFILQYKWKDTNFHAFFYFFFNNSGIIEPFNIKFSKFMSYYLLTIIFMFNIT